MVHIHKDVRKNKLDAKARPIIFLGYHEGSKGYEFWDCEKRTVVHSHDATFKEFNFPARQQLKDTIHPSMEEEEEIITEKKTEEQQEATDSLENTYIPVIRLENFPNQTTIFVQPVKDGEKYDSISRPPAHPEPISENPSLGALEGMEKLPTFGQKSEMLPEPYSEGYIPSARETRSGAWMNTETNRWYPSTLEHLLPKTA
jgi:hypothetical protein